jgi:hypothetical protein
MLLVFPLHVMFFQAEEQAAGRDGEPYKVAKLCFSVLFYQILSNLSVYCRWEIRIWSRSIQGWRHIRKRTVSTLI